MKHLAEEKDLVNAPCPVLSEAGGSEPGSPFLFFLQLNFLSKHNANIQKHRSYPATDKLGVSADRQ